MMLLRACPSEEVGECGGRMRSGLNVRPIEGAVGDDGDAQAAGGGMHRRASYREKNESV
jgi:hypothetical protein